MTDPAATATCQTIELQLTGQPAVEYRWGSGSMRPDRVVLTYIDDRRLAHLYGTWIREDGEQTDDPVDQLYRHDDDWPDWLTGLALHHHPGPREQGAHHVKDLTTDAEEKRARLFRFIEAGADESDFPSFAAALDEYVNAVTAIDTAVMEKADRECDEHIAAGREFRKLAERTRVWGQQNYDRANRYRARLDGVMAECRLLMGDVSGLNPSALAGRRDAVTRIREAAHLVDAAVDSRAQDPRQPTYDAVFAYIHSQPRDFLPTTVVDRNAMIWHAVHAALDAMGVPSKEVQQP